MMLGDKMIAERLKDIRIENDLTQTQIVKILNTTQNSYNRWENSIELISLKKLTKVCNYFNTSMDYLVGITRNNIGNGKHNLNSSIVGNNIIIFRKDNKLSQKDLATLLNTSQSTISAYEAGKTIILTAFALEIVKKYNISSDWLCGRKEKS